MGSTFFEPPSNYISIKHSWEFVSKNSKLIKKNSGFPSKTRLTKNVLKKIYMEHTKYSIYTYQTQHFRAVSLIHVCM